ncbi:hypothetical protein HZA96_01305 [Candidatus Woesearchaeota archaeon]|nr:hypothetical protein [Candidatus Woesearchaeota archaeon]
MKQITISEDKLNKILLDMETLIDDVASLVDQDEIAKKRLSELQTNPSIARSEKELDQYLKKRG